MFVKPKATLTALVVAGGMLAVAAPAEAASFANCTAMHRTYKYGVAKSDAAARYQVRQGNHRPAVRYRVYMANRFSDRDKDGTACEA